MATDVIVPEVGEVGMEVTFVRWLREVGAAVNAGDSLFEIDTAKAVLQVEAYVDGTLADLRVKEGDLVAPHQVVAIILGPGETTSGSVGEVTRA
jgi:pyruvate/2-oxoglutarate dehydrogenase complex dihydrolipoamide acyltransferase (E2) component